VRRNRPEDARAHLEEVLRIDPSNDMAKESLARLSRP